MVYADPSKLARSFCPRNSLEPPEPCRAETRPIPRHEHRLLNAQFSLKRDAFAFSDHDRRGEDPLRLSREGKLELTEETRLKQP